METTSLNDIAKRISDVVLEERYLNKESLTNKITPILKIWFNMNNSHKKKSSKPKDKLLQTIEIRGMERDFYKEELKKIVGVEGMNDYYSMINKKTDNALNR